MIKKILLSVAFIGFLLDVSAQTPTLVAPIPGPKGLTVFNNKLYASGVGLQPRDLWEFDGTNSSIINIPLTNPYIQDLFSFGICNNQLFFHGKHSVINYPGITSLWALSTSGTPTEVTDTLYSFWGQNGPSMATIGQEIFFDGINYNPNTFTGIYSYNTATNNIQRRMLYKSFVAAVGDSLTFADNMIVHGNKIYFIGHIGSPTSKMELMVFDPTTNTCNLITTYSPSLAAGSDPRSLFLGDDNKLYFSANVASEGRELFVYDFNNSPVKLTSLNNASDGISSYGMHNIIKWGNAIYFSGDNGITGFELMKYDLSSNTTSTVKNIAASTADSDPDWFISYNNKLYFTAADDTHGVEIWSTDGTSNGTVMAADINPSGDGYPEEYCIYNNALYFGADDGISGQMLFRLDGANSVTSIERTNNISLYPNPAHDNITIKLDLVNPEDIIVTLTDATGKTVYNNPAQQCQAGVNTITVPVQQLPVGIYQYRIANVKNELIGAGNITRE